MKVKQIRSIPAGDNPFEHDLYNMGTELGTNVIAMHANFPSDRCDSITIIDTATGERIEVEFAKEVK